MPARSVCLVTLSLSEAGPGRFGGQVSVTDIYHAMPYHTLTSLAVIFACIMAAPHAGMERRGRAAGETRLHSTWL